MQTNAEGVNHEAIEALQSALRPAVMTAERKGVPPSQQAALFAQLAYAQFQRSDYLDFNFEAWVVEQRRRADETQILEGLLYEIEQAGDCRDPRLVTNTTEVPRSDGRIPWHTSEDHPPETVLDGFWKCPHCRETMPTLYELWRYSQAKARCVDRREDCQPETKLWHAFNEGVHEYRDRIEGVTMGLDHRTRQWAMEVVEDVF